MQLGQSLTYRQVELSFGTSGLRGLVADMTDLECYINTSGFLDFLKAHDNLKTGETVYLAGDLRESTPRIMQAVAMAVQDAGNQIVNCGLVPTPAVAYYAMQQNAPCIMVTGSHIPADRNGIKFYKRTGEVLKDDEAAIRVFVEAARRRVYEQESVESPFNCEGSSKQPTTLPDVTPYAHDAFLDRYGKVFASDSLAGKHVIVYQHSAVGRDMLVAVLEKLGARVTAVGRSDAFVPIDTENVTEVEQKQFREFSRLHKDTFAIVSTDGDSDRPFVIDENGEFYRGDVLGVVVASFLKAKFAAVPISSNDAVDEYCRQQKIRLMHTKIGSPYVITAMQTAPKTEWPVVGWEVNGGFLTGVDIDINGQPLAALPTRDAMLPILCALVASAQKKIAVSSLFATLPQRFTGGGLLDVGDVEIQEFRAISGDESTMMRISQKLFDDSDLGRLSSVDVTDGLRLVFGSNVVLHFRSSGNAPQLRVYSNASSQQEANGLVARAIKPQGYIEQLLDAIQHYRGEY